MLIWILIYSNLIFDDYYIESLIYVHFTRTKAYFCTYIHCLPRINYKTNGVSFYLQLVWPNPRTVYIRISVFSCSICTKYVTRYKLRLLLIAQPWKKPELSLKTLNPWELIDGLPESNHRPPQEPQQLTLSSKGFSLLGWLERSSASCKKKLYYWNFFTLQQNVKFTVQKCYCWKLFSVFSQRLRQMSRTHGHSWLSSNLI
jgi:hypothetical protein